MNTKKYNIDISSALTMGALPSNKIFQNKYGNVGIMYTAG